MKRRLLKKLALLCLSLTIYLAGSFAQDYYVSSLIGADTNDGLSEGAPFKTIAKAVGLVKAGGTVNIMNGTYSTTNGPIMNLTPSHSGTASNYITYKALTGHSPKITAKDNVWNVIIINASYIIIDGLELVGDNANLTYEGAYKSYTDYQAGIVNYAIMAKYNCGGIMVGGPKKESSLPHHVIIRNCKVHDFPGGGIGGIQADYQTFENNLIYNNAWYMMYAGSGISILCPFNFDSNTAYRNVVRNNICYNNKTQIPWVGLTPPRLSDGNGIILDINKTPYPNGVDPRTGEYTGRTLVENNICYNNGGSGIHAYGANHVDILNNTAYNNGIIMNYGNIYAGDASDVKVLNNIIYAKDGGKCNTFGGNSASVIYDYNVYFNGTTEKQGPHDIFADPKFVNASTNPALANFTLQSSSPAINIGSNTAGEYSPKDIRDIARPISLAPDAGAYEYESGSTPQTITFNALPTLALGAADFEPGAAASSGLTVTYKSSNKAVATIVNNKIQLVNGGTCTITASQGGDATYSAAADVSQTLTVTGGSTTNLITNGTFDTGTTGWSWGVYNGAAATNAAVAQAGFTGNAVKATITSLGTIVPVASWSIQLSQPLPLVAGKTYSIKFRASADAVRTMDVTCQSNTGTKPTYLTKSISLSATPTNYSFNFTPSVTDASNRFKFYMGNNLASVYIDDIEITALPTPEINVKQLTADIVSGTGSFNFGDVDFGSSKTVVFTIENQGDRTLNLISSHRVLLNGKGFTLISDAPATIGAMGNATFEVKFEPTINGAYSGTISIPNDDANENPYSFTISAKGVNGPKVDQTITFNALPVKSIAAPDFDPGAVSTSGMPVTLESSNTAVATIVNGKIHIVSVGTTTITASQAGDANFNPAASVQQQLTVSPNLIDNPTFDTNTNGWSTYQNTGVSFTISAVPQTGFTGNACKATITNGGTTDWYAQISYPVALVKDKTYAIKFKASADAARSINVLFQGTGSYYFSGYPTFNLSTQPTVYGPYYVNCNQTDATAKLKFYIGNSTTAVYIDDVEVVLVPAPEMNIKQATTDIPDNTGSFNFGDVTYGTSKTVDFTIENIGDKVLNLTGNPKVTVTGAGFSVATDAPASIDAQGNASFQVKLTPVAAGAITGTVSLVNSDLSENPYNFALTAKGIQAIQTIAFDSVPNITYGDANISLVANSTSGLPVAFTVVSGPGVISNGNSLAYTSAGTITIEASQAGNANYIAAAPVQRSFTVNKKQLTVTAENKTVTYGDEVPELSYTITGFVAGQSAADLSGSAALSTSYTSSTSASESPAIVCSEGTLSSPNYAFALVNGQITINKKQLTVTADNKTVTYGDFAPVYTYSVTGFIPGQTIADISGSAALSSSYTSSTSASESPVIVCSEGTLSSPNYSFVTVNGEISINKKLLTVTADDKLVTYGDPAPVYTCTITGFVLGQSASDIMGSALLSSTYTPATPATESPVIDCTQGTLSSPNYLFATVNGKITIKHTFPMFLEAEEAAINGGKIVSIFPGFTGTGYVDHINKASDYIEWTVNASGAGVCTLYFKYALVGLSRSLPLTVNGSLMDDKVEFPRTGLWKNWETATATVYLNAGINKIKISGCGTSGPSFDNLVVNNAEYAGEIEPDGQLDNFFTEFEINAYPVPAVNDLKVEVTTKNTGNLTVSIFDLQGKVVYSKIYPLSVEGFNTIELDVQSIKPGIYLLKVNNMAFSKSRVIVIVR